MSSADVRRTLDRSLSARTIVALVLGALGAIAFVAIADEVLEGDTAAFDRAVTLGVHRYDGPLVDVVMKAFTFLGSAYGIALVVTAMVVWALARRAYGLAAVLVATTLATEAVNEIVKRSVGRPRPALFVKIDTPYGSSFPSAHSMVSVVALGMAAMVAAHLRPHWRTPLAIATPPAVAMIGLSRVYLGVHWATDVLAGFSAGSFMLVAGMLAVGRIRRHRGENEPSPEAPR
jgi:membrane-associated phospholipid phosphatase